MGGGRSKSIFVSGEKGGSVDAVATLSMGEK